MAFAASLSRKGGTTQSRQNNPRVLQRYVTYDTLQPGRIPAIAIFELAPESIAMSKQAEFAVILKMNPMFADLGADELQRISALCHTQHLNSG